MSLQSSIITVYYYQTELFLQKCYTFRFGRFLATHSKHSCQETQHFIMTGKHVLCTKSLQLLCAVRFDFECFKRRMRPHLLNVDGKYSRSGLLNFKYHVCNSEKNEVCMRTVWKLRNNEGFVNIGLCINICRPIILPVYFSIKFVQQNLTDKKAPNKMQLKPRQYFCYCQHVLKTQISHMIYVTTHKHPLNYQDYFGVLSQLYQGKG